MMKHITYIEDFESWVNSFSFYCPINVRFSETDMFGHMNNTIPFIYFEQARIEFFKHKGFMSDWVRPDHETIPVVANLQCDYLTQVFFDEQLYIYVKAHDVGTSSVDLHYMAKKEDGTVCFTGRGTMVNFNKRTGKGEKWTEEERDRLLNTMEV